MNCKDAQFEIDERLRKGGPSRTEGRDAPTLGGAELSVESRGHIASCPVCSAYLAELGELRGMLERSDLSVRPGELDDITFEKIVAVAGGQPEAVRPRRFELRPFGPVPVWLWVPVAAAAAIALMVLIPRFTNNTTSTITIGATPGITSTELINDIAESDSLGDEVLAEMADDINMDYIAEALIEGSDINDLLHGLTQSEMEALSDKIENPPATGRPGKG